MDNPVNKVLHFVKDISDSRSKINVVLRNLENENHQERLITEMRIIDDRIDKILTEVIKCFGQ